MIVGSTPFLLLAAISCSRFALLLWIFEIKNFNYPKNNNKVTFNVSLSGEAKAWLTSQKMPFFIMPFYLLALSRQNSLYGGIDMQTKIWCGQQWHSCEYCVIKIDLIFHILQREKLLNSAPYYISPTWTLEQRASRKITSTTRQPFGLTQTKLKFWFKDNTWLDILHSKFVWKFCWSTAQAIIYIIYMRHKGHGVQSV